MTSDSGREFLLRMRAEGRTDDEIRAAFRTSGWAEADIDALFAALTPVPSSPSEDLDASTSGTGAPAPTWVRSMGWCWGAFGLSWIWGIANGVYVALLALLVIIPVLGWLFTLGFAIWLGARGHSLAWRHRRFSSAEQFRSTMRSWNTAGLIFFIVAIGGSLIYVPITSAIVFPVFAKAREKSQQASCMSNEKQLALGVLMFAADHNEVLPSSSTVRQDVQPYTKNPALWQCPSGHGDTYAMNPAVSGLHLTTIAQPAQTVLLYEVSSAGQPVFPHNDGADLAFVDGHVKWLSRSAARVALARVQRGPGGAAPVPSSTPQASPPPQAPAPTPQAPKSLGQVFERARDRARLTSCESNVKQLDLALLMYSEDYDEHFPPAAKARACLYPYIRNNQLWQCPSGGTYALNPKLSELAEAKLRHPAETVSFHEVDASGKPIFPHLGEAVFGFADGHVRAYKRADAPSLALPTAPAK